MDGPHGELPRSEGKTKKSKHLSQTSTSSLTVNFLVRIHVGKGPSIYDVHTEGEGVRLRWTHVDRGGGGQAPCERLHRKLKLESTDPPFFSCKEVGVFFTRISSLDGIKSGNFSAI